MESTTKNQSQASHAAAAKMATSTAAESGQNIAATVGEAVHAVGERGAEVLEQAKQKVSDAYEQTTKNVTEQYEKAIDYGRENPGTTALIALGIGVGIGVLLTSSLGGSRSRRSRFAEPVLESVSTLARALFR